jgi:hypothetical protein
MTPQELLSRIEMIAAEKSGEPVKQLMEIWRNLWDVDYMNKWTPAEAAEWAAKPRSEKEVKLHTFIQDQGRQEGMKWGFFAGAGLVVFVWAIWG